MKIKHKTNQKDGFWIFFAKMNEQLQYTWNFQLSMLSLKNGTFHSHLLPPVHLQIGHHHHQKKKKTKQNKQTNNNNMEIQPEGEVACLILKLKITRECFWRIEDQPSMKSDGYTLSLSLWVSFSHTTPSIIGQICHCF